MASPRITRALLVAAACLSFAASSIPSAGFLTPETPKPVPDRSFLRGDGETVSMATFLGQAVLVHLWAPWCAPCRDEMPALDRLQREFGNTDFTVVAVSIDAGPASRSRDFLRKLGTEHLVLYIDRSTRLQRDFGVPGLPSSILVNADGLEVARMIGQGEWDEEATRARIHSLLSGSLAKAPAPR